MRSSSPSNRHGPFWIVIIALGGILGLSLLLNLTAVSLLSSSAPSMHGHSGTDEFPEFMETHSYGSGTTKVVRIAYTGILTRQLDGGWLDTTDPVESALRQIRAARQDESVTAILLEVDSPGGEVTAADEIYHELTLFKDSAEGRKITVLVHDMAASGGYYISLPADRIVAQPTALIGSIGVIMQTLNVHGLSEKIGITDTTIKSGKNKDLLNPFQPVNEAQVKLLQTTVDAMYNRFVDLVREHRPIKKSELKRLADGRIFTADEALKHKLIDGIGYWEDAVAQTAKLLGVEKLYIVNYELDRSFFDVLMGVESPVPDWQAMLSAASTPRFLYLWRP